MILQAFLRKVAALATARAIALHLQLGVALGAIDAHMFTGTITAIL